MFIFFRNMFIFSKNMNMFLGGLGAGLFTDNAEFIGHTLNIIFI